MYQFWRIWRSLGESGTACFDPSLLPGTDVLYVNSLYWSITTLATVWAIYWYKSTNIDAFTGTNVKILTHLASDWVWRHYSVQWVGDAVCFHVAYFRKRSVCLCRWRHRHYCHDGNRPESLSSSLSLSLSLSLSVLIWTIKMIYLKENLVIRFQWFVFSDWMTLWHGIVTNDVVSQTRSAKRFDPWIKPHRKTARSSRKKKNKISCRWPHKKEPKIN